MFRDYKERGKVFKEAVGKLEAPNNKHQISNKDQ
jgi:hypothetical protein